MQSVDFYIFRHGETDWNKERRFQGSTDIPLNETGKEQALELKSKFQNLDVTHILCSDLIRAKQTAEIVFSDQNIKVEYFKELQECHLGDIEGMYRDEFDENYGDHFWEKWKNVNGEHMDFRFPNAESPREHLERLLRCLEGWGIRHPSARAAVSTHGGAIWRLIHFTEKNPELPETIPNCGLYHLRLVGNTWQFIGSL